jgi:hypothetical protein
MEQGGTGVPKRRAAMTEYRYKLQQGGGKCICPACRQRRFVRYIDTLTGEEIADEVGKCDREDSCGYHLRPSEYFRQQGMNPPKATGAHRVPMAEPSYMEAELMQASFTGYERNNFCRWLVGVFGEAKALELAIAYRLGTAQHWPGACVFWQIDAAMRIRAGKIMLYDAGTGRRVKEPFNHVQWVHTVLKIASFNLKQCLFGEHLIASDRNKPVAVVESEKTAIVGAGFMPEFIWLATAGKGNLSREKLTPLQGRKVTLFPDLGAYEQWKEKSKGGQKLHVSDILEKRATPEERAAGLDLADYLLREHDNG